MDRSREGRAVPARAVRACVIVIAVVTAVACGASERSAYYELGGLPDGYQACGVSDGTSLTIRPADAQEPTLFVYADGRLDDPYRGVMYGVAVFEAVPIESLDLPGAIEVTVAGKPALLGGADTFQLADLSPDAGRVLTWSLDDTHLVQLAVRGDDAVDLVPIAERARIEGTEVRLDPAMLPEGFVDLGDIGLLEGQARFRFALYHERRAAAGDDRADALTLLGSTGDQAAMEAFRFRALESRRLTVQGRPAVGADIGATGDGPYVVAWLVEDNLILRLFSFELATDELAAIAERVVPADAARWAQLLSDLDPPTCRSPELDG